MYKSTSFSLKKLIFMNTNNQYNNTTFREVWHRFITSIIILYTNVMHDKQCFLELFHSSTVTGLVHSELFLLHHAQPLTWISAHLLEHRADQEQTPWIETLLLGSLWFCTGSLLTQVASLSCQSALSVWTSRFFEPIHFDSLWRPLDSLQVCHGKILK